jgi:hypothetical protein
MPVPALFGSGYNLLMPLPRLTTLGTRLAAQTSAGPQPVRLKGLNRSGLQHKPTLALAGMPDPRDELRAWRQDWGAQILRICLAVDYYLDDGAYRDAIAEVVAAGAAEELYLMLELHGTSSKLNEPLPTPGADRAWADLARRYGGEPHVVFDLWNEPHDVPWGAWQAAATALLQTIRGAGAGESLVIVGGLDWSYDLSPLLDPANRLPALGPIAYATHPYPFKSGNDAPPHGPPQWDQKFGRVAHQVPVMVTEFGCDASGERPYGFADASQTAGWIQSLLDYVDAMGLSALAWSAGDRPQLTLGQGGGPVSLPKAPPDPQAASAGFGTTVRAWMRGGDSRKDGPRVA